MELRNVEGTLAALGWVGSHTIVVDRREGKAGVQELGYNGAQFLAKEISLLTNSLRRCVAVSIERSA